MESRHTAASVSRTSRPGRFLSWAEQSCPLKGMRPDHYQKSVIGPLDLNVCHAQSASQMVAKSLVLALYSIFIPISISRNEIFYFVKLLK